jgi:hypothetical protein
MATASAASATATISWWNGEYGRSENGSNPSAAKNRA